MPGLDLKAISERIASGDLADLIPVLIKACEERPAHVAGQVILARALEAGGQRLDALRVWRRAHTLCPDSPVIRDELRRVAAVLAFDAARETRETRAAGAAEKSLKDDEPYHDLDDLIKELEGARIVPDPQVEPVSDAQLEPDVEDVVSETLAKIYANQRFFGEAARVYEKLAVQQPERRDEFIEKAQEIRGRIAK